jgi:hypothetical protein
MDTELVCGSKREEELSIFCPIFAHTIRYSLEKRTFAIGTNIRYSLFAENENPRYLSACKTQSLHTTSHYSKRDHFQAVNQNANSS